MTLLGSRKTCLSLCVHVAFPSDSDGKEFACNAGDLRSILELGGSPGEGNGNPLLHFYLENSMDRGAWQPTSPQGHKEWGTSEQQTLPLAHVRNYATCISVSNRGVTEESTDESSHGAARKHGFFYI